MTQELKPPPAVQDPTIPMYGYFQDYPAAWMDLHEACVERAKKGGINLLFIGDSLTEGWNSVPELWRERFGKYGAANFGIGGDRTQQVLWRIQNGSLDGIQPKVVVLLIGVNNIWGDTFGSQKIAAGVKAVVHALKTKLPSTRILVLGILPTQQDMHNPLRKKVKEINAVSAQLDNGKDIRFLDVGVKFMQQDGSISPKNMPDYLHLTPDGYAILADAIQPLVDEMMGE